MVRIYANADKAKYLVAIARCGKVRDLWVHHCGPTSPAAKCAFARFDAVAARELQLTRYDTSEAGSAASLFTTAASVCGIYILEFENGQRYVGQTTNITKRYATHRRNHGDVLAFSFAACPAHLLDAYEREQVRIAEAKHSLRNLNLTGWPGGLEDRATTSRDGRSILLPWERERRGLITAEGAQTKPGRFWELSRRDDYDEGYEAAYESAEVAQYVFESWGELAEALPFAPFLDAAYKLNTAMMRRGAAPTRKHDNVCFASDLLRRSAWQQWGDPE